MGSRLRAALRTYTTRPEFWAEVWGWGAIHVVIALVGLVNRIGDLPRFDLFPLLMSLIANGELGTRVGTQVKVQFANPQAKVMPRFAGPHLLVAGGAIAVAVVFNVWVVAWASGMSGLAAAGFALLVVAASAWWSDPEPESRSQWLLWIFLIAVVLLPTYAWGSVETAVLEVNPLVWLGAVCTGIAALAALGARFWRFSETMPLYAYQPPRSTVDATWDLTPEVAKRELRKSEARVPAGFGIVRRLYDLEFRLAIPWVTASGTFGRLLLRQVAGRFLALPLALGPFGFVLFFLALQRGSLERDPTLVPEILLLITILLPMMGVQFVGSSWLRRWPYLARESLYPLGRAGFVRDLARSFACDTVVVAIGQCAGIMVGLAVFCRGVPLVSLALPYLVLTAAEYAVFGAAMLWLLSFHDDATLGCGGVVIVIAILLIAWALPTGSIFSPLGLVAATGVSVAVARWFYRRALTRWRRVELD